VAYRFCRFEGELPILDSIAPGRPVLWGGDALFCRPVLDAPPVNILTTSIALPNNKGNELQAFVARLAKDYKMHVILRADETVVGAEGFGVRCPTLVVEEDHWLEALAARSSLLVSTRLHPAVYSLCCGVPVLGVDYSDKMRLLLEQVEAPVAALPFESATIDDYMHAAETLLSTWSSAKTRVAKAVQRCRAQSKATLAAVARWVMGEPREVLQ